MSYGAGTGVLRAHAHTLKGLRNFCWFLKGAKKRPYGPRLPIGAGGGQVVLYSKVQTPLGLQSRMESASANLLSALNQQSGHRKSHH